MSNSELIDKLAKQCLAKLLANNFTCNSEQQLVDFAWVVATALVGMSEEELKQLHATLSKEEEKI